MLVPFMSRPWAMFGLAAPVTTAVLAVVSFAGGEANRFEATTAQVGAPRTPAAVAADLPAAFAASSKHRLRHTRTLASVPGADLFAIGSQVGPETPLDKLLREGDRPLADNGLCPPDMASIDDRYCVDRYEASLLEMRPDGKEVAFSPFQPADGHHVRAVSEPGVFPQGYISEVQAKAACALSGKRLCTAGEWKQACMGPRNQVWGYGAERVAGRCNDHGRSPVVAMYGREDLSIHSKWNWERMNQPTLNQLSGTLAKTGSHEECTNDWGVYDMVGNLHEWVADPHGTFQGGYYQDTTINGDGCTYVTRAHAAWYHDYSTGFRCCADVAQ